MTTTNSYTAKANSVEEAKQLIVPFLGEELPKTIRVMNRAAICEGCELGRNVCVDNLPESEAPGEELYELYGEALNLLLDEGKVLSESVWEMDVFFLSPEAQDEVISTKTAEAAA